VFVQCPCNSVYNWDSVTLISSLAIIKITMINDWFHCNCKLTVKNLAFWAHGNNIRYVSQFQFECIVTCCGWLRLCGCASVAGCSSIESSSYIFCRLWYGSIFIHIFLAGSVKRTFSARVRIGGSFIQGHWFWYQSKARKRLPVGP